VKPGALSQAAALDLYRAADDLDWTYISPPFPDRGRGEERAISAWAGRGPGTDAQGASRITYPDFAIALVERSWNAETPSA